MKDKKHCLKKQWKAMVLMIDVEAMLRGHDRKIIENFGKTLDIQRVNFGNYIF